MFIENGLVKCVGYRRGESDFTIGKLYQVIDGKITSDTGFTYFRMGDESAVEWLNTWYIFEIVENNTVCSVCGAVIDDEDYRVFDGQVVCSTCKEDMHFCDCCGRAVFDDYQYINDEIVCDSCIERHFVTCENCGELVHRFDSYSSVDGRICQYCADEYYRCCDDCGELVHEDNIFWDEDEERGYCAECWEEHNNRVIQNYHYKPVPIFRGGYEFNRPLYMGVELEIDKGGENHENARQLLDIVNADGEHLYAKHDGSIYDGFELVSHPATLEYHLNNIEWEKLMREAVTMGYRSHETDTCGLHIHVSRNALGNCYEDEETTISKIVYFIENNWREILKFTRRTESNLRRWASRYGIDEDIEKTYKRAKGDYNRYRCINLQNDHTIEFRMFRGTLKYSTFVATLQLVNNICNICKSATMDEIEWLKWSGFISRIDEENNTELIEYLKIRGLYV